MRDRRSPVDGLAPAREAEDIVLVEGEMNRRDFLRGMLGGAASTTTYFVFGSGLWTPGYKITGVDWGPPFLNESYGILYDMDKMRARILSAVRIPRDRIFVKSGTYEAMVEREAEKLKSQVGHGGLGWDDARERRDAGSIPVHEIRGEAHHDPRPDSNH